MKVSKLNVLMSLLAVTTLASMVLGDSVLSSISLTLCGVIQGVRTFVGILAIALFLVGGVLYATAHFIPTSVDFRKSMQGWSTAMIIGGIIGLIVVIIAPWLVNFFASFGAIVPNGSAIPVPNC